VHYGTFKPFNAHASHYSDIHIFGYNSPADIARELFKLSTDEASLLGTIKKNVLIWVRGSPGRSSQSGCVFGFLTNIDWPWTPIPWAKILTQTYFGN